MKPHARHACVHHLTKPRCKLLYYPGKGSRGVGIAAIIPSPRNPTSSRTVDQKHKLRVTPGGRGERCRGMPEESKALYSSIPAGI